MIKNKTTLIIIVVFFVFSGFGVVAQFLDIEGERPASVEKEKAPEPKKERKLPVYVARNVKAQIIPDIKGAIKITWDADPAFDDEFIIGRALEVPHSVEKALNAKSIKVVPQGAERVAIDSNLPPGSYFYVVLAKEKVQNRDVELYPNVNYTTVPVVIEKEAVEIVRVKLPEQVTLIHAMVLNRNQVLVTWKGTQQTGIVYNVYRGSEPLNSAAKVRNADAIAQLPANKTSYVDAGISKTGNYFYAVTTKDVQGNEDLQLVPDQSYTVNGVFVAMQAQNLVTGLSGQVFASRSVKLSWSEKVANQRGKYLIYRDSKPISSSEKLALSEFVGSVAMGRTDFIDENPPEGALYYAVLGKLEDGTLDNTFVAGENYLEQPIVMGERLRVQSISAAVEAGKVSVRWNIRGKIGVKEYAIARLQNQVNEASENISPHIVSNVDITEKTYIDAPPSGTYYYAILPREKSLWRGYDLIGGVNITESPVVVRNEMGEEDKFPSIEEHKIVQPEQKKIAPRIIPPGDVDSIIRETFFRGKYNSTIRKLDVLIKEGLEGKDAAKARLFIGRAYIEKGRYRKSLEYLLRSDVKEHFRDEAKFWSSFAISQVNGKK